MHPLDGPRLKVGRAESEIQVLDDAMFAIWKDSPYHIVRAERNPKTGNDIYRIQTDMPPFSLDWGVTIGEIAHNLHSALDGLVYQLALLKTHTPTSYSQFPIFLVGRSSLPFSNKLPSQFEFPRTQKGRLAKRRGDGRYMIRDLRSEHQTLIERLQPYKRGRGGRKNPLFRLKESSGPQMGCRTLHLGKGRVPNEIHTL